MFQNYIVYVMSIIYFICFYIELKLIKKEQQKKKFAVTSRVKRLYFTLFILFIVLIMFIYKNCNDFYGYLYISLFGYFSFIITFILNIINIPAEKFVYYY